MLRRVADTVKILSEAYIFLKVKKKKTRSAYQDSSIVLLWLDDIENFYFHL